MIDISWDLQSNWSRNLFCLSVCASLYFFSCTNEDRIFFICTGNLNNFLWVKFYFSFLCLVLLVIRQWLGHKKGTFIRCFVIHLRKTYSELFFSYLLRIRMCCTEIWCNRTNKLGNYGGFNASRLFHLNFFLNNFSSMTTDLFNASISHELFVFILVWQRRFYFSF